MWADLAGDDEWYTTESAARVVTMSTAYASKDSVLAGHTGLATDIRDAVRWIADKRYYAEQTMILRRDAGWWAA